MAVVRTVTEQHRIIMAHLIKGVGGDRWYLTGWSEAEISNGLGLPAGRVKADLQNLADLGLVDRMPGRKSNYRASMALFDPSYDSDFYETVKKLRFAALADDFNPLWDWVRRDDTIGDLLRRAREAILTSSFSPVTV